MLRQQTRTPSLVRAAREHLRHRAVASRALERQAARRGDAEGAARYREVAATAERYSDTILRRAEPVRR